MSEISGEPLEENLLEDEEGMSLGEEPSVFESAVAGVRSVFANFLRDLPENSQDLWRDLRDFIRNFPETFGQVRTSLSSLFKTERKERPVEGDSEWDR